MCFSQSKKEHETIRANNLRNKVMLIDPLYSLRALNYKRERLKISSRKLEIPSEHFMPR